MPYRSIMIGDAKHPAFKEFARLVKEEQESTRKGLQGLLQADSKL